MLDSRSKILLGIVAMLIILSVSASYYRFVVLHDYIIEAQVDCDPATESCFVWNCDPSFEGECTGNPEEDTWFFKYAYRNAQYIPECNEDECDPFKCPQEGEAGCIEIACSEATLQQYGIEEPCVFQPNSIENGKTMIDDYQIHSERDFESI